MKGFGRLPILQSIFAAVGIVAIGVASDNAHPPQDPRESPPNTIGNPDSSTFAEEFPHQHASWKATSSEDENTLYSGSGFRDYLASSPNLVMLWAGYPFAIEYNQARGHYYALEDVKNTGRRNEKTPATCWSCKSPDVPRMMLKDGTAAFYAQKFDHYTSEMGNAIGCADCHEPTTMKLQVSRPALIEGFKAMGKDVTKASNEEMRSLVCAQCHVEYHFESPDKYLKFPWNYGLTAEAFEKYYEESGHKDWKHSVSGANMVKMQHPDYELFQQGLHGKRGVSCADCHMPGKEVGEVEFTDHQIRSPLYNPERSCGKCHDWDADQARQRVFEIQNRNKEMLERVERVLTAAHLEIGDAAQKGATDAELEQPRKLVSKAQMYWDYIAAANGMGFHAPQESARVLGKALDLGQECRLLTQSVRNKYGATEPLKWPDFDTKDKAQSYIKPFVEAANAKAAKK